MVIICKGTEVHRNNYPDCDYVSSPVNCPSPVNIYPQKMITDVSSAAQLVTEHRAVCVLIYNAATELVAQQSTRKTGLRCFSWTHY